MHLMVLLGDEAQVEAHFGPFGDSANFNTRYVLAVIIDKYLPPIYDQRGGNKDCYTHTHVIMACFHLYPRIIRNAEHRVETGITGARIRFSRKRKGEKRGERPVQHRIGPSPPHHSITSPEEWQPREDRPEWG
jgi:hypothetical protein